MTKLIKKITAPVLSLIFLLNMSSAGMAETTVSAEVGFIFNTLLFLICGFLVMFMAAGFAMLESGMVTSKSVSVICAKNIGLFSIAGIMFWLVGYNLAYGIPEGGFIGSLYLGQTLVQLTQGILMDLIGISKWYFVQLQFQLYQELWLKELNYGHSFYLQQFYQEFYIQS